MNAKSLQLLSAPIIEAVIDIDCDMPPTVELAALVPAATQAFSTQYPNTRTQLTQETQLWRRFYADSSGWLRSSARTTSDPSAFGDE